MNVILTKEQFNIINIFFTETKMNMLMEGIFTKINYSTPHFTMNGIFIYFTHLTDEIVEIEKEILQQYSHQCHFSSNKKSVFSSLFSQHRSYTNTIQKSANIDSGNVSGTVSGLILKISGIWETQTEYGITYKILSV
jgi:hypothetical protein